MASDSSVYLDVRESIFYAGMQQPEQKRRGIKDNWKESEMIVKGFYIRTKKMRRL